MQLLPSWLSAVEKHRYYSWTDWDRVVVWCRCEITTLWHWTSLAMLVWEHKLSAYKLASAVQQHRGQECGRIASIPLFKHTQCNPPQPNVSCNWTAEVEWRAVTEINTWWRHCPCLAPHTAIHVHIRTDIHFCPHSSLPSGGSRGLLWEHGRAAVWDQEEETR